MRVLGLERGRAQAQLFRSGSAGHSAFGAIKRVVALNFDDGLYAHQGGVHEQQSVPQLHASQVRLERPRLNHASVVDGHGEAIVLHHVAVTSGVFFFRFNCK